MANRRKNLLIGSTATLSAAASTIPANGEIGQCHVYPESSATTVTSAASEFAPLHANSQTRSSDNSVVSEYASNRVFRRAAAARGNGCSCHMICSGSPALAAIQHVSMAHELQRMSMAKVVELSRR